MDPRSAALISDLGLAPHEEGGYFREIFRSPRAVTLEGGSTRSPFTVIHFLLSAGDHSRWHRLRSDEVWVHLDGDPVDLHLLDPLSREVRQARLGGAGSGGERMCILPAETWQAAEPAGGYGLVACLVAPGFEFSDMEFMAESAEWADLLRARRPELARLL